LAIPVYATVLIQFAACRLNWFENQKYAREYLGAAYLYEPQWCQIKTVYDTWNFLLEIFTSGQAQKILTEGSSLWSMHAQFWGSVYVYALTIMCARMNNSRFLVYFAAFWALFLTTNINLVRLHLANFVL
jgi:hypothetical protein